MLITLAGFVGKMKVRGKSWQWTRRWHTSHTFRTESALAGVISLGWPILALSGYLSTPADAQTSIPSVLGMKLSGILGVPFFYWSCTLAWKPPLRMAASEHRVHFVTNSKCPYAQRTWIALEESSTAYDMTEISLYGSGGKPGWFMDLNPKGEVPVIVVNGKPIVGSEETIDYLMQGPLNPDERRAISSRWRGIVNDRLKPSGKRAVFSGGSSSDLASLTAVLKDLEACLASGSGDDGTAVGGPFVCGDLFSVADASAFPFLQRVHGEFGFPSECVRLEAWYACASRRPGVRKTIKKDFWWWW